jgi:hypothetical protein
VRKLKHARVSVYLVFALTTILACSCANNKIKGQLAEDELFITRKYIGDFLDYKHVPPERFGKPHLVWIKTTIDSTATSLSVYTNECSFEMGDRLYLRRSFMCPGIWGYWEYQLENDNKVFYKVSEFKLGEKVLLQSWF